MRKVIDYLKMIKFSHTFFALPFSLIAFIQAWPKSKYYMSFERGEIGPSFFLLAKVILCMISARSAAMGFNRFVDRKYDKENPRTKNRELPQGILQEREVLIFVFLSSLLFIAVSISINIYTGLLSPLALFLVLGYSYTKRFTPFCHFILALAISLAPLATWIAILEKLSPIPFLWFGGLFFYISAFDIIYACQDVEFDKKAKLFSLPVKLGTSNSLILSRFNHFLSLIFFIAAGIFSKASIGYYFFVLLVAIMYVYLHIIVNLSTNANRIKSLPILFYQINTLTPVLLFIGVLLDVKIL